MRNIERSILAAFVDSSAGKPLAELRCGAMVIYKPL